MTPRGIADPTRSDEIQLTDGGEPEWRKNQGVGTQSEGKRRRRSAKTTWFSWISSWLAEISVACQRLTEAHRQSSGATFWVYPRVIYGWSSTDTYEFITRWTVIALFIRIATTGCHLSGRMYLWREAKFDWSKPAQINFTIRTMHCAGHKAWQKRSSPKRK